MIGLSTPELPTIFSIVADCEASADGDRIRPCHLPYGNAIRDRIANWTIARFSRTPFRFCPFECMFDLGSVVAGEGVLVVAEDADDMSLRALVHANATVATILREAARRHRIPSVLAILESEFLDRRRE